MIGTTGLAETLSALDGVRIERSVPAADFCTYRVGGPLGLVAFVSGTAALGRIAERVAGSGIEVLVIGRGSNLLVADAGFDGLAIHLVDDFASVAIDGSRVVAGAAALLPVVARSTVAAGLTGMEWAVGVPGSVGGAVRMNAGGHGSDIAASLVSAEVVDLANGRLETRDVTSLELGYRESNLAATETVASAMFELDRGDRSAGEDLLTEIVGWRRENQPGGPNAGSVFTNPPGDSAGRLIDATGCKGLRLGTAEVSPKHANFIQADPGGSADDIVALMVEIVHRVEEAHGITLSAETRLIGFRDEVVDRLQRAGGDG